MRKILLAGILASCAMLMAPDSVEAGCRGGCGRGGVRARIASRWHGRCGLFGGRFRAESCHSSCNSANCR